MGLDDLVLRGVRWELSESKEQRAESKERGVDNKTTDNRAMCSVLSIAPVSAPNVMSIDDINLLQQAISEFNHPLKRFANNTVVGVWASESNKVLIITDMPSGDDDETGNILTGRAGRLLDKMLNAIELTRNDVSIIPLLFWRTPGGRAPTRDELDLAYPFIKRAIELLKPRAVLTLGTLAGQEIHKFGNLPVDVFSIQHPNYLMLKPDAKRDAWKILQDLQNLLKNAE